MLACEEEEREERINLFFTSLWNFRRERESGEIKGGMFWVLMELDGWPG